MEFCLKNPGYYTRSLRMRMFLEYCRGIKEVEAQPDPEYNDRTKMEEDRKSKKERKESKKDKRGKKERKVKKDKRSKKERKPKKEPRAKVKVQRPEAAIEDVQAKPKAKAARQKRKLDEQ